MGVLVFFVAHQVFHGDSPHTRPRVWGLLRCRRSYGAVCFRVAPVWAASPSRPRPVVW